MTDKEIIKALGLCFNINHNAGLNCGECPYKKDKCSLALYNDTIDLINRQQAEIERLTDRNKRLGEGVGWLLNNENGIELIRADTIKEFAEKLKDMSDVWEDDEFYFKYVTTEQIDNLVKEMVGAE